MGAELSRRPLPLSVPWAALAWLLAVAACGESPAPLLGDGHRELLLDGERVRLVEGFDGFTELEVNRDYLERYNLDRDELPLLVMRGSRLIWDVGARPGAFVALAARYHAGGDADGGPCAVTVTALAGGQPVPGRGASWELPPLPAEPDRAPGDWREGPSVALRLALPEGAESLVLAVAVDDPSAGYVTLLSPRVEQQPVPLGELHHYEQARSLLQAVPEPPAEPLLFAQRTALQDGLPVTEETALPAWEVVGAFEGRSGRPALALTGAGRLVLDGVQIRPGDELRFGLALDHRLPEGSRARVEVFVADGPPATVGEVRTLVGSVEVGSQHWQALSWPLGDHAGVGRRLIVELSTVALPAADVVVREPDFALGDWVQVSYRPVLPRVGLSNLALVGPLSVPWRRASAERPSVVLLHVETLRADRLEASDGEGRPLMPSLAALSRLGTRYTHALAPSPWTLPSTATLLTGLPPAAHGVVHHDRMVLPDDVPTLAERARAAGVATGAVLTNDLLDPHKGYGRGFDRCAFVPYANARQLGQLAREFLDDHLGRQFLLLLHCWDPHHPYRAPADWRDRYVEPALAGKDLVAVGARMTAALEAGGCPPPDDPDLRFLAQRQMGDIAYLDLHLGRLLDDLLQRGLDETTTVIVTADHGEEFGEQGWYGHGSWLYDECTRVPLVIARAGQWGAGWRAYRAGMGRAAGDQAAIAEGGGPGDEAGGGAGSAYGTGDAGAAAAGPWAAGSAVIDEVVSTSGLHAEVLRLLDVPYERDAVRPALSLAPPGTAFVETHKGLAPLAGQDPLRRYLAGLRSADQLLLLRELKPPERKAGGQATEWRLYQMERDGEQPREIPAQGEAFERLRSALQARLRWSRAHRAHPPAAGTAADAFEALRALGYVGGGGAAGEGR